MQNNDVVERRPSFIPFHCFCEVRPLWKKSTKSNKKQENIPSMTRRHDDLMTSWQEFKMTWFRAPEIKTMTQFLLTRVKCRDASASKKNYGFGTRGHPLLSSVKKHKQSLIKVPGCLWGRAAWKRSPLTGWAFSCSAAIQASWRPSHIPRKPSTFGHDTFIAKLGSFFQKRKPKWKLLAMQWNVEGQ